MAEIQLDAISWTRDENNDFMPLIPPKPFNYPEVSEVEYSIVYGYDDQYEGTRLPGGVKPAVPVLTFADNFDGETTLVTVSGSTAATTNRVYAKADQATTDPVLIATISGDGTATATLPNTGVYLAYVLSTSTGDKESIGFAVFSIASGSAETTSLFESTAAAPARNSFYTVFGLPVMYQRGASQVILRAIPSDTASKYAEVTGFEIEAGSKDWSIQAGQLIIGGVRITPKRGDAIRDNLGNLWQVMPRDGAPPYIEADPEGVELVIRTKQTERG